MGGSNAWRTPLTGADWMREVEKRVLHEERRPQVRTASDLLGPGIAPYSVLINDWNAPETEFNGFFHSVPVSLNAPVNQKYWMGTSQGTEDGFGYQRVVEYWADPVASLANIVWGRRFYTLTEGSQRQFTPWRVEDNKLDTGWLNMVGWASGWIPAGGAGGPGLWQARQVGNVVYLRGNAKNDAFAGTNQTICSLANGIIPPLQTTGFSIVGSSQVKWGNVLADGTLTASAAAATPGSWMQIVGYYLTD